MRLDRLLSEMNIASRKDARTLIKGKKVKVNGEVVTDPGFKVNEIKDEILVNDETVRYSKFVYYMLNKPAGVISATKDNNQKTVLDIIKPEDRRKDLFPVGRLDKDTVGLLVLTNDGETAHNLLAPGKHVPKKYLFVSKGKIEDKYISIFKEGFKISDEFICKSADLELISHENLNSENLNSENLNSENFNSENLNSENFNSENLNSRISNGGYFNLEELIDEESVTVGYLTITEGKFHQVKRMIAAAGGEVIYLKRLGMGELFLDENLVEGEYRTLTDTETELLKGINNEK